MPLLTLDHVSIAFGHLPLLDDVSLQVETRERVCLIGRNGSGKSTLLRVMSGECPADAGTIWQQPNTRVARLEQDVPLSDERAVFDVVADGLGFLSERITSYHHAATAVAEDPSEQALARLGRMQQELEKQDGWRLEQRVEMVLNRLSLPADVAVNTLSGGWRRRVLLAKALVGQPDILLLDEPTNHLDIDAIQWLEDFLNDYAGAVVFVTHDRTFLQRLATRIIELDRGHLSSWPGTYDTFLRKKEEWLSNEALSQEKFDKKLAEEEAWLRQGIKARRTRNEGRVKSLLAMRAERSARRDIMGTLRLQVEVADPSGKRVFEARGLTKAYGENRVIEGFSCRVTRGDRIGLIGSNGAGKTTLLRMLLGDAESDSGEVIRGENVQVAYYDQQRERLNPDATVFDTIGEGNDHVVVNGRTRHVNGYLADFLFPIERARSPVRSLSGGERNRLLLARIFTRPANVLVLDEPTNDLDIESLELLEAQLAEFPGTLLLVSHDRTFLDNAVTSTWSFEGDGRVVEYVGGYEDWLRQRPAPTVPEARPAKTNTAVPRVKSAPARKRLTFHEQREYAALPERIESLEAESRLLTTTIEGPEFYRDSAASIRQTLARLETVTRDLQVAYERWLDLESRAG